MNIQVFLNFLPLQTFFYEHPVLFGSIIFVGQSLKIQTAESKDMSIYSFKRHLKVTSPQILWYIVVSYYNNLHFYEHFIIKYAWCQMILPNCRLT